jgi:hypothetical protein
MDASFIEPRDGDLVVVRASSASDGQLSVGPKRYAVIELGLFQLVATRMAALDAIATNGVSLEWRRRSWASTEAARLLIAPRPQGPEGIMEGGHKPSEPQDTRRGWPADRALIRL